MIVLAIESSCDETAVAILKEKKELLSNIVYSQMKVHSETGGVIPEVASRLHVEKITHVIDNALKEANLTMEDIDVIAVTKGPGLIGSLHVGVIAAKTLAWLYNKPLVGTHHIAGHIYANAYVTELKYPLLSLVVSGGHTQLVYMSKEEDFNVIAETADDAIGEAYDKVARVMGLGYPGGPIIDKMASLGVEHYKLPTIKPSQEDEFSYSGLKSAIIQCMNRIEKQGEILVKEDLAFAFQEQALKQLIDKTKEVLDKVHVKQVLLAGGVAANKALREKIVACVNEFEGIECVIPPMKYCTDNAAMIAMAGSIAYEHGDVDDLSMAAHSNLDLKRL